VKEPSALYTAFSVVAELQRFTELQRCGGAFSVVEEPSALYRAFSVAEEPSAL
jgi:hypothetical protein